tara:strand:+ start:213 stop:848 length:636 start_codon:yes stop_codon:yes gene_type:complete
MLITENQIKKIIRQYLLEMNRRSFLKGAASLCALGVTSACKPSDYGLTNILRKNTAGMDYPSCVQHPKIEPDLNDLIWQDQVIDFQSGEYVGIVELVDFMSQPAFDNEYTYVEEDGEFLIVTFMNVPKDADILKFNGITGVRYFSDNVIENIYSTPQDDIVLTILKFKFKTFEHDGVLYVHHPSYERGGVANVPLRNSLECSQALIQWMEN